LDILPAQYWGMNMVKRYDIDDVEETGWNMNEQPDGPWIKFEDYAALEAENERLKRNAKALDDSLEILKTEAQSLLEQALKS
jgi:hypothetical protein